MSNRKKESKRKTNNSGGGEASGPAGRQAAGLGAGTLLDARKSFEPPAIHIDSRSLMQTLCSIGTNAWRAHGKMVDSSGEPKEEMKKVVRHIDGIEDALKELGVEINDPIGKSYDSGMALKVISFEPVAGIAREEIQETVKPSIYFRGLLIQVGEVIVGTPLEDSSGASNV